MRIPEILNNTGNRRNILYPQDDNWLVWILRVLFAVRCLTSSVQVVRHSRFVDRNWRFVGVKSHLTTAHRPAAEAHSILETARRIWHELFDSAALIFFSVLKFIFFTFRRNDHTASGAFDKDVHCRNCHLWFENYLEVVEARAWIAQERTVPR